MKGLAHFMPGVSRLTIDPVDLTKFIASVKTKDTVDIVLPKHSTECEIFLFIRIQQGIV